MVKNLFAEWGQELSDEELAKALATAGIYVTAGVPLSRLSGSHADIAQQMAKVVAESGDEPIRCVYAPRLGKGLTSGKELAAVWELVKTNILPPRIEVVVEGEGRRQPEPEDPAWFADQLRTLGVGAASSFLSLNPLSEKVEWEWPLRVGFLPDHASRLMESAFRETLGRLDWLRPLVEPVDTVAHLHALEVLVLPGDLNDALQALDSSPYPVYAYVVVVLGGRGRLDWQSMEQKKRRITELTQAQGVIVTNQSLEEWLQSFVSELAHDQPLDLAACAAPTAVPKACWLSTPLLKSVQPSRFGKSLLDRSQLYNLDAIVSLDPRAAKVLQLDVQPAGMGEILDQFDRKIHHIGYGHERDGALVTAAVHKAMRQARKRGGMSFVRTGSFGPRNVDQQEHEIEISLPEIQPPRPPRHLQCEVYALLSGKRALRVRTALVRMRRHEVRVFIGILEPDSEALSDVGPVTFPEEKLPPTDEGGHVLTVVFHEPNLMKQPQLKTLFLPRNGSSLRCHFRLHVPERADFVDARITVLHENRVLQTGVLRGEVEDVAPETLDALWRKQTSADAGPGLDEHVLSTTQTRQSEEPHIQFTLSGAVQRAIAELDHRSRFDAAFVLNHSQTNQRGTTPGMLAVAGNQSGYVQLSDKKVQQASNEIDKALDTGEWDFKDYEGLTAPGTTKLLRRLAIRGGRLYRSVIDRDTFPKAVTSAKRIQIVAANRDSNFPFEFVYEFTVPGRNAALCPMAAEALRTGTCPAGCHTSGTVPAPYVCPLGFWGMSRVIEWHIFSSEQAKKVTEGAFRVDIDDGPRDNELPVSGPALMAYSKEIDKADKACIPSFQKSLSIRAITVDSWKVWVEEVKKRAPKVLLLLVHTDRDEEGTVLEVGPPVPCDTPRESRLPTDELSRDYICGPEVISPIVLLLGCTTDQSKMDFNSVAGEFEYWGAKILVATKNLIYGPKAVKLAEMLLTKLDNLKDGEDFGDVMLAVRRTALAEGNPMVLCLTAYGDADWRLRKEQNMFTVEMLPAKDGDCLWIEYGKKDKPHRVIIDGGPIGAHEALRARIEALPIEKRKFELIIVTHIDSDHIAGILKLLQDPPEGMFIRETWFNAYRHLVPGYLGAKEGEFLAVHLDKKEKEQPGFWNAAFKGGAVVVPEEGPLPTHTLNGDLKLTVLGPDARALRNLKKDWDEVIAEYMTPGSVEEAEELLKKDKRYRPGYLGAIDIHALANADFEEDTSAANGSSIVIVAEYEGKRCLFAADAFPSKVADGLKRFAGTNSPVRLDAVKVPHHGSQKNNSNELYSAIDSRVFLISTDGSKHEHPNLEAIARILDNKKRGPVQLVFNYRSDFNSLWDSDKLREDNKYATVYPTNGGGIRFPVCAD